jgi:hypothetical protein
MDGQESILHIQWCHIPLWIPREEGTFPFWERIIHLPYFAEEKRT